MGKIVQSLVAIEGKYVVMPPWKEGQSGWGNIARPNVHKAGGDSSMVYPINTKFVDFDRTFIYGYMHTKDAAAVKSNVGLCNLSLVETITWGATAGVAGDILVGILASTLDSETAAAADIFAGGYLMPRTNPYSNYRIVKNTAYNGGRVSGEMDITIEDDGLVAAVIASVASCFLDRNPYVKLCSSWAAGREYVSWMGVTLIDPTASTYQWVQTWGPVHMPSDEVLGSENNYREARFAIDGSILGITATFIPHQRAGYAIPSSGTGTAMVWLIQLQLER